MNRAKNISQLSLKFVVSSIIFLMLTSCVAYLNVDDPVDLVWDRAERKSDRLIIFLPGLYDTAETFKEEDFFVLARKAGVEADMLAVGIHVGHFINRRMIERIEQDVFFPTQNQGYKNIWLVGMSLGGLNSLEYFRTHEGDICGVVALAPYILNESLISEIEQESGTDVWQPRLGEYKDVIEKRIQKLWLWLKNKTDASKIYLGYGDKDVYSSSHRVFAKYLNKNNVIEVEGKHNWKTGKKIWQQQLLTRKKTGLLQPCQK